MDPDAGNGVEGAAEDAGRNAEEGLTLPQCDPTFGRSCHGRIVFLTAFQLAQQHGAQPGFPRQASPIRQEPEGMFEELFDQPSIWDPGVASQRGSQLLVRVGEYPL